MTEENQNVVVEDIKAITADKEALKKLKQLPNARPNLKGGIFLSATPLIVIAQGNESP